MTKQELEEKIKNNESVYIACINVEEVTLNKNYIIEQDKYFNALIETNDVGHPYKYISDLDYIFNTKAQAQHYIDNANVTRTEKLPFVTWEEFNNGKIIAFMTKYGQQVRMCKWESIDMVKKLTNNIMLFVDKDVKTDIKNFDYTEENFYKAYETCRKLFLGEKDR